MEGAELTELYTKVQTSVNRCRFKAMANEDDDESCSRREAEVWLQVRRCKQQGAG